MIEIFKTSVSHKPAAELLVRRLQTALPQCRINIDLHDCDNILRVEGKSFSQQEVVALVQEEGFDCSLLD